MKFTLFYQFKDFRVCDTLIRSVNIAQNNQNLDNFRYFQSRFKISNAK